MSEEKRLWYHWVIIEATEEEMDALGDRIAEAVGCTDDPDHVCPHFQVGGYRLPREGDAEDDERGAYIEELERRIERLTRPLPADFSFGASTTTQGEITYSTNATEDAS